MNTLNTFVILLLVGSMACSHMTLSKLNNLKSLKAKSHFSKTIISVAQVQLQANQGSTDAVVRMLQGLVEDLHNQQAESDSDHNQRNSDWDALIAQYKQNIVDAQNKIAELQTEIARLQDLIKENERKIAIEQAQAALVNQKLADLSAARKVDEDNYNARVAKQGEMLKAVNYIIDELKALVSSGSFVQLKAIKSSLQKLVKQNPIQALVQLTMTFDQQSVEFAGQKLAEIRDSLVASLRDEDEQDAAAKQAYDELRKELNTFLKKSNKLLDLHIALLANLKDQLSQRQDDLASTQNVLATNQQLQAVTEQAQIDYNNQYAADQAEREHEEAVIEQVVQILESHETATDRAESNEHTD